MESWLEFYEKMKGKLDRELLQEEIDFLKWVYDKYLEELEQKSSITK